MPQAKIRFISSGSESVPGFEAENLLRKPGGRTTWKGKAGAKVNAVVVQLEQESVITSIDIGNEFSALIEVLVAKSCDPQQMFSTLVPSSSFMDPMECRLEKNGNRVRMFTATEMVASTSQQKWDLVKVSCSQPFNPNLPYGIAFVSIAVDGDETAKTAVVSTSAPKIAMHFHNTEADTANDSSQFAAGEMFKKRAMFAAEKEEEEKRKNTKQSVDDRSGSDISKAGTSAKKGTKGATKRRNAHSSSTSPDRKSTKGKENQKAGESGLSPKGNSMAKPSKAADDSVPGGSSSSVTQKTDHAAHKDPSLQQPQQNATSFNELLKDVHFTLSGYQNPQRGAIRDKALEMGATYEIDWTPTCTHLVCAFSNTPKRRQVGSRGIVVTHKWIEMCYMKKKRFPEKQFSVP